LKSKINDLANAIHIKNARIYDSVETIDKKNDFIGYFLGYFLGAIGVE